MRWLRPRGFGVRVVVVVVAVVFVPAVLALLSRTTDIGLLTLLGLPIAVAIGGWLAWRLVRALDKVRRQALQRADTADPLRAVHVDRDDEIGDVAAAFNRSLSTLDERRKATESFVADLAHEVKNPVATVRTCADALERGPVDEERAARLARALRASHERLDTVVSQLLSLARIQARSADREREPVDLATLADGIADSVREDERCSGVAIRGDRRGDAHVHGDSHLLEAAMRNLIDNALAFAESEVRIEVIGHDDNVAVEVADDGPGIAEQDQERIFERFVTTRLDHGGTGLGLAFVRAIAEAHGGSARVRSAPGQGARFTLQVSRSGQRSHAFHT